MKYRLVRDTRGQPIAGASVSDFDAETLTGRQRGGDAATRTEADGRFTLWVSPGPQSLIATHRAARFAAESPVQKRLIDRPTAPSVILIKRCPMRVFARIVPRRVVPLLVAAIQGCTPYQPPPAVVQAQEAAPEMAPVVAPVPEPLHLDLRASAPASLSGTVRDHTGQPFAGAQVCAWSIDRHGDDATPSCVTTDAAGVYTLSGLVPTRHEVHASAAEHQPSGLPEPLALQPGERRTGADLQLVAGGTPIHGVVRDTRGQPIEGASVSNFDGETSTRIRRGGAAATRTDPDGRFTLWLSPGPQSLIARADGFASTSRADATAPGRYSLELERGATLSGQVLDMKGAPVVGARVTALANGLQQAGLAYTDAGGNFKIAGLRPGLYKPRAEAPGQSGEGSRSVFLGSAATSSSQVFSLRPVASVSGRMVVVGGRQTCSQGQVSLHSGNGGRPLVELAGPDGEVYFPAVQPGTYYVQTECLGAVAPSEIPPVEVGLAPVRGLVWQFVAGRSIRGTVVDAEGRPLAGANVRVEAQELQCGAHCSLPRSRVDGGTSCQDDSTCAMDEICDRGVCAFAGMPSGLVSRQSDATGRFVVAGLPSGRYTVSASEPGSVEPSPVTITVGELDVDGVRVVATPPGQLGGVVVDERGAPWGGALVELFADRGSNIVHVSAARTDDDGHFALFAVKPGDYVVRAHPIAVNGEVWGSEPHRDDVRARVDVRAPAEVRLTLAAQRGQIRGQVRGTDGVPVPDAFIVARRELPDDAPDAVREAMRFGAAEHTVRADAAGEFSLSGLAAGTYTLRGHRGGGVGEVYRERVAVGSKVTLTLPATFAVAGRLTSAPPGEFMLRVQGYDNGISRQDTFAQTDGRWAFEGLPAGTYEVHADLVEHRGWLVITLADRSLDELVLSVGKPGGIRGMVLDAGSRTPLGGVPVKLAPRGQMIRFASWPTESVTDDSGHFEFAELPPGQMTLTFPAYVPGEHAVTVEPGHIVEISTMLRLDPVRPKR